MKKFLQHMQQQILAGVLFLIPVFVVTSIVQKLWAALKGGGDLIAKNLGLKSLLGSNSVTIATAVLLVLVFYAVGWLVRFSFLTTFRDWLEESVLQHIPGYLTYKAKMHDKLQPAKDARIPVMVTTELGERPGLLIEENQEFAIVFFPNSPDSNNGQSFRTPIQMVRKLDSPAADMIKAMQGYGKGLL